MTLALRISLIVGIAIYIGIIIVLIRKKRINLRYSILWFVSAVIFLIMTIFPGIINKAAEIIGVQAPVNAVFLAFIFFILIMMIYFTSIVSKQREQIKRLTQKLAIIEDELNKNTRGK